eukprot:gene12853-3566_t
MTKEPIAYDSNPLADGDGKGTPDSPHATSSATSTPSRFGTWVNNNKLLTVIIALFIAGAIVTAIVVPVCVIHGCPAHSSSDQDDFPPGLATLIVSFNIREKNALDVIPAILHQYISRVLLEASNLQILDFDTEEVLQEARKYLAADIDISLLTRDFPMSRLVPRDANTTLSPAQLEAIQNVINNVGITNQGDADGAPTRRRLNAVTVNDPLYTAGNQYYIDRINATGAWKYTTGVPTVIVAVIDSGADMNHPDLKGNMWVNSKEIPGNGIDDDGNGYIDDVNGWDFNGGCIMYRNGYCVACGPTNNPQCVDAHGTHVAGLVAAIQNNGIGMTGVAPNVKVIVLRVSDCMSGSISASKVVEAYEYAAKMGAHIISCSFGTDYTWGFSAEGPAPSYHRQWYATYEQALKPLAEKNILVVAAAGNENIDLDRLKKWGWAYLPCLVDSPNLICIGATDQYENRAYFSNYGATTVHLAAPGSQIYSLLWQNNPNPALASTYGIKDGTSMSTPIVSGVAALTLAVLSSNGGSNYKATQAKDILLASADVPAQGRLPFLTGSRVNAGRAVYEAGRSLNVALKNFAPEFTGSRLDHAVTFKGFKETYYKAVGNQFSQDISGGVVAQSVRDGLAPTLFSAFSGFQYSTGYLVSFEAYLQLPVQGLYSLKLATAVPTNTLGLYIGGKPVPIGSNQIATFNAQGAGWFKLELRVAYPSARLDLTMRAPNSGIYQYVDAVQTSSGPGEFKVSPHSIGSPLNSAWHVHYSKVDISAATPQAMTSATPDMQYQHTGVFESMRMIAGEMKRVMFPNDPSAAAVIGYTSGILKKKEWPHGTRLQVVCKGCQVLLNGLVVIDVSEGITSSLSIAKTSSCLNLRSTDNYELTVRFASAPLNAAALYLSYSEGCSDSDYMFPIQTIALGRIAWSPEDGAKQSRAGYVGGLQCDVYRFSNGLPTYFNDYSKPPSWKVRLPNCPADDLNAPGCSGTWNFAIKDILPGLQAQTAAGTTFGVRCWSYIANKFASGTIDISPADKAEAYLGGIQVFDGKVLKGIPSVANMGKYLQQFSVEWVDVPITTNLVVMDGATPLRLDLTSMRLPIARIADVHGYDINGLRIAPPEPVGTVSTTVLSVRGDVPRLVNFDLQQEYDNQRKPLPTAVSAQYGLETEYSYGSMFARTLRYTDFEGFFFPPNYSPQTYTMKVDNVMGATTSVTMGDVTVLNSNRVLNRLSPPSTDLFQVHLPTFCNIYTRVIVKSQRDSETTIVKITTLRTPSDQMSIPDTVWNTWQWAPTRAASCANGLARC